jgi:MtN3 and saliva related transmembrane protein
MYPSTRAAWRTSIAVLAASVVALCACGDLVPGDAESLIYSGLKRSEIVGFLAGLGTTFAAIPDLVAMLRRRSSTGMNPRMAAIMGAFQLFWIYYGLLIASRPVIVWNVIAVAINFITVAAYWHYVRKERIARAQGDVVAENRQRPG